MVFGEIMFEAAKNQRSARRGASKWIDWRGSDCLQSRRCFFVTPWRIEADGSSWHSQLRACWVRPMDFSREPGRSEWWRRFGR